MRAFDSIWEVPSAMQCCCASIRKLHVGDINARVTDALLNDLVWHTQSCTCSTTPYDAAVYKPMMPYRCATLKRPRLPVQVKGRAVFPGAGMFEATRAAGAMLLADERLAAALALTGVAIPSPLLLGAEEVRCLTRTMSSVG